jgi:4-carboxymuconolactone decarboxylase
LPHSDDSTLPDWFRAVRGRYPEVAEACDRLGDAAYRAGELTQREQRLVKLAFAMGAGLEGAVHSHARRARAEGISANDLRHVALLAITTLGFPAAVRSMTWLEDILHDAKVTERHAE